MKQLRVSSETEESFQVPLVPNTTTTTASSTAVIGVVPAPSDNESPSLHPIMSSGGCGSGTGYQHKRSNSLPSVHENSKQQDLLRKKVRMVRTEMKAVRVSKYLVNTVHCTVYSVHCTIYIYILYTVQCTVYTVHFTEYTIYSVLYSKHRKIICFINYYIFYIF